MASFWNDSVQGAGKLPLFLCFVAFVVTFVVTRIIVRMIRSGRGPFKDNEVGGVHVHHMVPGIFLMIIGGLIAIGGGGDAWDGAGAIAFGMGLALVLDEFALLLRLDDVYWSEEGRLSVDVVFVIAALMALLIVVGAPFGMPKEAANDGVRVVAIALIVIDLMFCAVTAAKGKLVMAAFGVLIPIIAYVGAIRLARPASPWAKRRYGAGSVKMQRARARETQFDARWRTKVTRFQEMVAGAFGPTE